MGVVVEAIKSLWIKGRLRGDDELVQAIGDVIEAGPKASGRTVIDEAWPGTAVATLETWHRTLGVAYDPTLSVADQQARLQAMMTALGGASIGALQAQVQKEFPDVWIVEVSTFAELGLAELGLAELGEDPGAISSTTYNLEGSIPLEVSAFRLAAIIARYGPAHMIPTSSLTIDEDSASSELGVSICGTGYLG